MEFNNKWTKEINDEYRQMIKERKTIDEIREYFGFDLMSYHPKKKFNYNTVLSYGRFQSLLNEISFYPNYIFFSYNEIDSIRFSDQKDYICNFNINNIDYVAILEVLIENNNNFKNKIVYNVFFTTKLKFDKFNNIILGLSKEDLQKKFKELQTIVEEETNYNDIIKIFNALSYILIKMSKKINNCVYMISETDDKRKVDFYIKSIKDSFNNYELIIDESVYFPNRKSYYFKIKN